MKIFIKNIRFLFLSFVLVFTACETEETLILTEPDAEFTLQTPSLNNIFLNFSLPNNPAFTISWNDELTDSSSHTVEMATDIEFSTPIALGISETNNFSMSVMEFNDALNNAGILSYEDVAIYMRVTTENAQSNSILYFVTTYAVDAPQITNLSVNDEFILSDIDPELVAMTVEFSDSNIGENSTSTPRYEVQLALSGRDFSVYSSLGTTEENMLEITHATLNDAALVYANPEIASNFDLRIVATVTDDSGDLMRYSEPIIISINPYDVSLVEVLYGIGAGLTDAGWNWDNPVRLEIQDKVYSGNISLTPNNGGNFRFFTEKDYWGSGQNYVWYTKRGFAIDDRLVNAMDDDQNFKFIGTEGEYTITINVNNKTITLE